MEEGAYRDWGRCRSGAAWWRPYRSRIDNFRGNQMPIILWLLGVPLVAIVLLMLFGVL
jgi:hypothetical protein